MSDQPSLLLDIGNTSIKYAWYTFENHVADLRVMRTSLESLPELIEASSSCFLCNVNDDKTDEAVKSICSQSGTPLFQVHTQAFQFGIKNAYSIPSNMGSDRWMAIIAGAKLCDKGANTNYLVIDAGTAITCDFIAGNQHLGGWIAPGLTMARTTVVRQTKKVFDETQGLTHLELGKNTPQCVANGALAQMLGMLSQACAIMVKECQKFEVYISGGDAPLLINAFNAIQSDLRQTNLNYIENLVLVGLATIAHEHLAKND